MHPIETAYRQYGDVVLRRARAILGSEAEAQEVLQQVFARWWERPQLFGGRSKVSTWLYRVTTRLCIDCLRTRSRRRLILEQVGEELTPGACAVDSEQRVLLRQVMQDLSDEQAMIAIYHFLDGMTHAEIAGCVGKSRRRVGQILQSCLSVIEERDRDFLSEWSRGASQSATVIPEESPRRVEPGDPSITSKSISARKRMGLS